MTIEQERLEVIRALTRIEDAALIRRVHRLVASTHSSNEDAGSGVLRDEADMYMTDQTTVEDATMTQPSTDLDRFGGKMEEKFDFEKLKREQPRRKHDPEAFAKLADSIEWEHTIDELLAMIRK